MSNEQLLMLLLKEKFGDTSDLGTGASTRVDKSHFKEAEQVKVGHFPSIGNVREWVVQLRKAVMSASGRPKLALLWICEIWKDGATFEKLKDSQVLLKP